MTLITDLPVERPISTITEVAVAPLPRLDAHVVLATNFIPPHLTPVLHAVQSRVRRLTILLSTQMEQNRPWPTNWEGLDVRLQHTITLKRRWRHPVGFSDTIYVHIPWDIGRQLRELKPDVVVSAELGLRTLLTVLYKRRHPDFALVSSVGMTDHTEQGRGLVRGMLRRWLVRHFDNAMATGEGGRRYLQSIGFDLRRSQIVPYTAEPSALYDGPVDRADSIARRLLFVGQLIERKGIVPFTQSLVNHARRHPDQQIEFTIVGGGPQLATLQAIVPPANLMLDVRGQCSFDEVRRLYGESGIFVQPTLADEWGLVVNEAMSAGLPVLGSIYGQSVEQLCRDDETGWTFRPDEAGDIESAIERALTTPLDRLREMREASREAVRHITPDYAGEQFVNAVRTALEIRRVRRENAPVGDVDEQEY